MLVVRPPVVFGAGNFANMYALIRQIDRRRFVRVGAGDNVKSLVYVDNLVDATLLAWRRLTGGFDVVNIVDKPDLTSRQIADIVFRAFGKAPPRLRVPLAFGLALGLPFDAFSRITGQPLAVSTARIRKYAADQTKFEADKLARLGFQAAVSLEEGLRHMVAWYQREGRVKATRNRLPPANVMLSRA